ncbi:U2 snRNP-associated SURP domain-containing protein [Mycoblastus sanguinarius]|nr:U2 snRNP-associated SURP domain-containing protein [Mycoblastus sanguinarius]
MAQDSKIKEFPDISNKLTAPTKKSLFERQKAEAEAKRQREQEETAAVYEDFIKSFDDEDNGAQTTGGSIRGGGLVDRGGFGGPSKRHFSGPPAGPAGRGGFSGGRGSSGPGSLGPPPSSLSRKRAYDGSPPTQREGLFAFEDAREGPADPKTALAHSDDEDTISRTKSNDRAIPKPTLRLSSLPPGTSPAAIKSFLPSTLTVDGVRILPPSGPGTEERRSLSAVVTLAKDTPALDIDTAVSALQNNYMGRGFYLSLSRHLSSAAVGLETNSLGLTSGSSSLPFGARAVPPPNPGRAPLGGHRGGFAPPSSYNPAQYGRGAPQVQVNVNPPADLKQLKLIHKTLEAMLTHGPDFEALLMTRKEVQMDEKWAWLWDSRSVGGVYYRWRLWDVISGSSRRRGRHNISGSIQHVFERGAPWVAPERGLPFEYKTRLEEFVSDSDYDSSEDEDSGDEGRRRYAHHHGGAPPPDGPTLEGDGEAYLNPLKKAKLTHLLARLPTTNAKLRRGDVARVTAFAIQHAGEGAEEVVQMITSNVQKPFSFTSANPERKSPADEKENADDTPAEGTPKPSSIEKDKEKEDSSPAKLIALYLISDILSSSSTSGVRHAWRYRQLFESALKRHKTFEDLGRLEKKLNWGRLRAEKWRRSVQSVLGLWEGWCVFPQASQEHFNSMFANPPLTKEEEAAKKAVEESEKAAEKAKSRWKTVDEKTAEREAAQALQANQDAMDIDDIDGEPMPDDDGEDLDGEPMLDDEDIDGEPMAESGDDEPPITTKEGDEHNQQPKTELSRREALAASIASRLGKAAPQPPSEASKEPLPAAARRRQRPKAEDMFADSDGE